MGRSSAVLVLVLVLTGCGGADPAPDAVGEPTASPATTPPSPTAAAEPDEPGVVGFPGAAWSMPSARPVLQEAFAIDTERAYTLAFASDGSVVAGGDAHGVIRVWDAAEGTEQAVLEGHTEGIEALAFLPDGRLLSGSYDLTARLWDPSSGASTELQGAADVVVAVAGTQDSRTALTGSGDGFLRAYSTDDGALVAEVESRDLVEVMTLSPDGDVLATGCAWQCIELWEVPDLSPIDVIELDGTGVNELVFSPDGLTLYGLTDHNRSVVVWDVEGRELVTSWEEQEHPLSALTVSPDGTIVAASTNYGHIQLWTADGDKVEEKRVTSVADLAFSPTAPLLAAAEFDAVVVYTFR